MLYKIRIGHAKERSSAAFFSSGYLYNNGKLNKLIIMRNNEYVFV